MSMICHNLRYKDASTHVELAVSNHVKDDYYNHASRSVFDCVRALSMLCCTAFNECQNIAVIFIVLCIDWFVWFGLDIMHHDSVPVVASCQTDVVVYCVLPEYA